MRCDIRWRACAGEDEEGITNGYTSQTMIMVRSVIMHRYQGINQVDGAVGVMDEENENILCIDDPGLACEVRPE